MPGRLLEFRVDGTSVGSATTNEAGIAKLTATIPAGTAVGFYPVDVRFAGASDLFPCDGRGWLQVTKALTNTWPVDRTGTISEAVTLLGYLRRSATPHGWTGCTSGLSLGTHTVRCEWAGDAWVDAGYGEANLTIY